MPIDYSMEKTPAGWKVYDVIVGGVSLVTNYRDEFTQQVREGGIDGLIKTLEAKNAGAAAEVIDASAGDATPIGGFAAATARWRFAGALTFDERRRRRSQASAGAAVAGERQSSTSAA